MFFESLNQETSRTVPALAARVAVLIRVTRIVGGTRSHEIFPTRGSLVLFAVVVAVFVCITPRGLSDALRAFCILFVVMRVTQRELFSMS